MYQPIPKICFNATLSQILWCFSSSTFAICNCSIQVFYHFTKVSSCDNFATIFHLSHVFPQRLNTAQVYFSTLCSLFHLKVLRCREEQEEKQEAVSITECNDWAKQVPSVCKGTLKIKCASSKSWEAQRGWIAIACSLFPV